jgi:hypothetical protein
LAPFDRRAGLRLIGVTAAAVAASMLAQAAPAQAAPAQAAAAQAASARASVAPYETLVRHSLIVRLSPARHQLAVRDRLTVPAALVTPELRLLLNSDLKVTVRTPGLTLALLEQRVAAADLGMDAGADDRDNPVRVNAYRIHGARPGAALTVDLAYAGRIDHPIRDSDPQYARAFSQSPGLIEDRGVYLAGSSYWVPQVGDTPVLYRLDVRLPKGWKSVSEGLRSQALATDAAHDGARDIWNVDTPTEEVHLIAARFTEYERDADGARDAQGGRDAQGVRTYAFLRTADAGLAARYLTATAQYLEMYQGMLGGYPYGKFALVENFWETGYGMPSFTLLGERIIRFPFILTSSYPHELLHNWWGNGVFVDFSGGNWCEGLTSYLSDHLFAEQRGQGSDHRRDILQRVTDNVTPETDFPVSKFRSRFDSVTEAIGYGKTAMMWNMLRERIGDDLFLKSLRRFYADQRFRSAGFDDLRRSFEAVTGQDLQPFFRQWLTQTGVPDLRLDEATRTGNRVTVTLSQVQEPRYSLDVPAALYTAHGVTLRTIALTADEPHASMSFDLPAPATRVAIDPQFQVYRRLGILETPPSLSSAFGAKNVLIVAPAGPAAARYAGLIKAWSRAGVEITEDGQLDHLPHDRSVWILGASNRFVGAAGAALRAYDATLDSSGLRLGATAYAAETKSLVATARNPENPSTVLVFVSAPTSAAADGLARKLPHYGKYSWLIFSGDAPDNEAKGDWPTSQSPLVHDFEPQAEPIPLPVRRALADLPSPFDAVRLKADVDWLAAPARQGRGIGTQGLVDAARYIAAAFQQAGLQPWVGDTYVQQFTVTGEDGKPTATDNVLGVLPGSNPLYAGQSVVISAHYDHLGFGWPDAHAGDHGKLHPGADDNASGVAALLELARVLADSRPERTLIFAAFSGEEAGLLGSREFVRQAQQPGARWPLSGMLADLNLDTVGRLDGGAITLLGADSATEWPFIFSGASATTGIATTVVTQAVNGSDHTAFVEAGVPAVQLFASTATDYHRPSDTADKIDVAGLVKVEVILREAAEYLASRPTTLHFTGNAAPAGPPPAGVGRRASTGIVPDMTYSGTGVQVGGVLPGSGAERAGIRAGDQLLAIGGVPTPDLRALAEALKTLTPGEEVDVELSHDGEARRARLTLGER